MKSVTNFAHPMVSVTTFRPIAGLIALVSFDDGESRLVDFAPHMVGPIFEEALRDFGFASGQVDQEIGTVVWPNGADLPPETLRFESSGWTEGSRGSALGRNAAVRDVLESLFGGIKAPHSDDGAYRQHLLDVVHQPAWVDQFRIAARKVRRPTLKTTQEDLIVTIDLDSYIIQTKVVKRSDDHVHEEPRVRHYA